MENEVVEDTIDPLSDYNTKEMIKYIFKDYIHSYHRGSVHTKAAEVHMMSCVRGEENLEAAKKWWGENATESMVTIDQCKTFAQKFWHKEVAKAILK